MPATAGRIRMPANNRLSVSDSLKVSEIWQKSVGYDPYAPTEPAAIAADQKGGPGGVSDKLGTFSSLAKLRSIINTSTPGACKKCGQLGHLTFQCRNVPLPPASGVAGGGSMSNTVRPIAGADDGIAEEFEEDSAANKTSVLFKLRGDSPPRSVSRRASEHETRGREPSRNQREIARDEERKGDAERHRHDRERQNAGYERRERKRSHYRDEEDSDSERDTGKYSRRRKTSHHHRPREECKRRLRKLARLARNNGSLR